MAWARRLSDDETVSLNVYKSHPAPTCAERETLRREIISKAREIGRRAGEISDQETDALIDDAFADIRRKRT